MLIAASWPSKSEAAVTMRSGAPAPGAAWPACSAIGFAAPIIGPRLRFLLKRMMLLAGRFLVNPSQIRDLEDGQVRSAGRQIYRWSWGFRGVRSRPCDERRAPTATTTTTTAGSVE